LISFITRPFLEVEHVWHHTNLLECYTISEILKELGYNVDVVNYDNDEFSDNKQYDLIIGFGQPIDKYLKHFPIKSYKLILYRNGAEVTFSDKLALKRLSQIFIKKKVLLLDSVRMYPTPWKAQHYFADGIIHLGNKTIAQTYINEYTCPILSLDLFYFNSINSKVRKDFNIVKTNFLWFGSAGAVHKGLDLLLEYFYNKPELTLYFAGLSPKEKEFRNAYADEINASNIIDCGFLNLKTESFNKIAQNCGSIISPSLSEGGGGATLNAITNGFLYPIVTENLGLDFDNQEIVIDDFTTISIDNAISTFLSYNNSIYIEKTNKIYEYIREKHTYSRYKENLKSSISRIINQ